MNKPALALCLAPVALLFAGTSAHADAPSCVPSRLMIVLDHSSSMNDVTDASMQSKWTIATQAIGTIASSYEGKIDLGLNVFPDPDQCSPGATKVEPGPNQAAAIIAALPAAPPAAGNYTPMSQTLDVVAADPALADASHRPSILLVTDGWQWCSPYDPATRTWPVDAVKRAQAKGIRVYVVGFGSSVDVATMNQMAVAAGTALAGCDPTGTDVSSPNKCYYQVDSANTLDAALDAVSLQVSAEICDGIDNNCDGQIDEGLTRNCANACGGGTETCSNGKWVGCDAPAPKAESCNGKDDNCDGTVDEGCICQPGDSHPCGGLLGACAQKRGTQTCGPDGQWGACEGATMPTAEVCNGIDDDCDGEIDNGAPAGLCANGATCIDGTCQSGFNNDTPAGAAPSGCSCQLGDGGAPPAAPILFVLLGLGGLAVRRRTR